MVRLEKFGEMKYDKENESWTCEYGKIRIYISYEKSENPNEDLVKYAMTIFNRMNLYNLSIEKAKEKYALNNESLRSEVTYLQIDEISFNRFKDKFWFMVLFKGGKEYRLWRTEFHNDNIDCELNYDQ